MKLAVQELVVHAPIDQLFEFLVDPELFVLWMAEDATLDPVPGGIVRWTHPSGDSCAGTYVEVVRPHRVMFTYGWGRASEMVGRHRDGRALALGAPDGSGSEEINDFGYEHDKAGLGCPVGAHVRRANPRNSTSKPDAEAEEVARRSVDRHRILRRGRPYGPTDEHRQGEEPRGLVFIALNAGLERQLEFVQHTWLNNPTFAGLAGEIDPLTIEQPVVDGEPGGTFTVPARPVRSRVSGLPSFTTTRGGAYFFLPGVKALARIAGGGL